MLTICFTGHRPNKFGGWNVPAPQNVLNWLEEYIDKLINLRDDITFISGAAQGIDQWAADIIIRKKEERTDKNIKLLMAIPYHGFGDNWPYSAREKLKAINTKADKVVYVNDIYTGPYLLQIRNEWMVDRSQIVLAIWDGSTGGTFNCVKYAQKENVKIIRYDFINDKTYKIG
ncbi:hypothetical protein D3C71_1375280 [compost metagenome]